MSRLLKAIKLGSALLPLVLDAIRERGATIHTIRERIARGAMAGDLDDAIRDMAKAENVVVDFVRNG